MMRADAKHVEAVVRGLQAMAFGETLKRATIPLESGWNHMLVWLMDFPDRVTIRREETLEYRAS
jgi:hypothetical protein